MRASRYSTKLRKSEKRPRIRRRVIKGEKLDHHLGHKPEDYRRLRECAHKRSPRPLLPEEEARVQVYLARWKRQGKKITPGRINLAKAIARSITMRHPRCGSREWMWAIHSKGKVLWWRKQHPREAAEIDARSARSIPMLHARRKERRRIRELQAKSPDGRLRLRNNLGRLAR